MNPILFMYDFRRHVRENSRRDAAVVARKMTCLINYMPVWGREMTTTGVLVGNWSGDYEDGKSERPYKPSSPGDIFHYNLTPFSRYTHSTSIPYKINIPFSSIFFFSRYGTVRAPVFGRHQFFGTSEHYGKAHGSLSSG